jgi:hypothetical protein
VQFVQQVNYGPVEAKRYFIPVPDSRAGDQSEFLEVTEQDLIIGNSQKLNASVCQSNDLYILYKNLIVEGTKISNATLITSSLSSTFTRRIPSINITGDLTLLVQLALLIFK